MNRRRGFSITEIFVTLTAMLVLMGLLLGWTSHAREMARISNCLANLHQLADAAQQYALSNHGAFPSDTQTASGFWYPELQPYDTDMSRNALCPDAATSSSGVGTSSLAWGPIPTSGPPYFTGYPWLENTISSYGLNTFVNPTGQVSLIASAANFSISGNQTYDGNIVSAGNVSGSGNLTVQGNVEAGNNISFSGNTNVSGSQTPNVPGLTPPSVVALYDNILDNDNPTPISGNSNTIDFSQNQYLVTTNMSTSGQTQVIGSGTLLVSGNFSTSGWFPANGSGIANINIVCLGNISFSGQTNISGGLYSGGSFSISGGHTLTGVIVSTGPFSNSGHGTIVQGHAPSFDPRASGKSWMISQPLFADSIWVDGDPQTGDPVPSNLQIGNSTLNSGDETGNFCINRHMGQVNVVFTDGSAHSVPLAQLWQLNWSANYTPTQVKVPGAW